MERGTASGRKIDSQLSERTTLGSHGTPQVDDPRRHERRRRQVGRRVQEACVQLRVFVCGDVVLRSRCMGWDWRGCVLMVFECDMESNER